jgi:hypothetical protein
MTFIPLSFVYHRSGEWLCLCNDSARTSTSEGQFLADFLGAGLVDISLTNVYPPAPAPAARLPNYRTIELPDKIPPMESAYVKKEIFDRLGK